MVSNHGKSRNPSTPQSIPLQDLSRPPDEGDGEEEWRRIRRQLSERLGGRTRSIPGNGRSNTAGRYERIGEGEHPHEESNSLGIPHIATPRNAHQPITFYDDGELSPVNFDFQVAMGGLSFDDPDHLKPTIDTNLSSVGRTTLDVIAETEPGSPSSHPGENSINENNAYFSTAESDRTPLTDQRHLQPISGSQSITPVGLRQDRHSHHASRSSPGARLGDDLLNAESGLHVPGGRSVNRISSISSKSISRSLSAANSNPLSSAGTILRKMSQRVVNLSNEPEIVDQMIRRQPSAKQARLDGPPSFPMMTEYAHDEPSRTLPSIEKATPLIHVGQPQETWQQQLNPLKGRSLMIFAPNNPLRLWLCELLVHPATEPVILILIVFQTILLSVGAAQPLVFGTRPNQWGSSWIDYSLLVLFIVYSLEIVARIIVSGLFKNALEYSTLDQSIGLQQAVLEQWRRMFASQPQSLSQQKVARHTDPQRSILRSFTAMQAQSDQRGHSRQQQRVRLARRAFLRHSFNRLDLLAVVSFWISFVFLNLGFQGHKGVYVFQMLSCLRILRLLVLTSGTSVILRSLKKAAPLLVNVAFLIGFFWLLFAIVGSQIFKSSLRRTCMYFGDNVTYIDNNTLTSDMLSNAYVQNLAPANLQFCGGHLNYPTGAEMPWVYNTTDTPTNGRDFFVNGSRSHKGFLCPQKSLCVQGSNPYNNTVSFDNVGQSLELVFVIMSSNTFSDLLYFTTDSDYLAGALFFAFGIIFMSLWLMNLLVAVITSSFQVIREESSASAFTTDEQPEILEDEEQPKRKTSLKRNYDRIKWLWILIIAFGLIIQSLRTAFMNPAHEALINNTETVVTFLLLAEIFLRFAVDWRHFFLQRQNWVDSVIAIVTAIIQIPPIHDSGTPYNWLTFFQIVRIYRVVLAVPITRDLIKIVLKKVTGLLNLIVFVFLLTFLAAIFAVQLFRGDVPPYDVSQNIVRITFSDIYNSFIGMYQVLSSENWTTLMYNATQFDDQGHTAWIGAVFFILWFILANFITLNMFIAVIQESFDVSEDEKRLQQVKFFLQQKELTGSTHGNLSLATIFKFGREQARYRDPIDYGPATIDMFKDAVVRDFLDEQMENLDEPPPDGEIHENALAGHVQPGLLSMMWGRVMGIIQSKEPNPFYSSLKFSRAYEELDPRTLAMEIVSATEQRKLAQRKYLQTHPRYNMSLFVFKPSNPMRKCCQQIVGPGRGGQRVEGVDPNKPIWYTFSFFIYANVVAMVLLACITTPLYQKTYFDDHGCKYYPEDEACINIKVRNWFVWTDIGFAVVFTIESIIKVIADGFFWTPNAYFRGSWGFIDGVVLVTLWINVATSLFSFSSVARAVGAFKALRALRLLNVSDSARDTFHSIIVIGGWKVLSAAFVSLSLLIPFAIYGLNLFNGQFMTCNDTQSSIGTLEECTGEYMSSPFGWNVSAPRVVSNPYYNFDNFGNSLFILFQIVSQEGWIDVMWSAMSARGKNFQPFPNSSQGNSVFFIVFNLLGSVFVLTLFVSVFMRNFTEQTGVAYLTADQRSWLEMRKLLRQISPSKRPSTNRADEQWKAMCYRIAVKKHGKWYRTVTAILIFHLILLLLEFYPEVPIWERMRDYLFLVFNVFYIINIVIRIIGLSWKRFRRSSWDLYSLLAVTGNVITTILDLSDNLEYTTYTLVHKLFLVSIALLLIPRNNQLDQLFKTAAASLTAIGNLVATWFVLFLVYAIALTQTLGLTRFGSQAKANLNFRTVPKALILLFRMSCGEGWNQIMEDYAQIKTPLCTENTDFFSSDCGSTQWARALFISWNIVSMYIFVSMFVSLIFESFSYVYQRSSGLSIVSREETRRFKQAWATFDPEGTGFIPKESFPRLLGELSGVFEMRIYDGDHTVGAILEQCRVETRGAESPAGVVHGVNLAALNRVISTLDIAEIRRRRGQLNHFYQEVLVSADPDRGIPFTTCLMILAHYKVITDKNSLRLEEFLRRRARLQRVEEQVRRNVVIGFFDTLYWSRQFRRSRELRHSARMMTVPEFNVPEIFIEGQFAQSPTIDVFPPSQDVSPTDTTYNPGSGSGLGTTPPSPTTGLRNRNNSFGSSPSRSERSHSYSPSPVLRARHPSHQSDSLDPLSVDGPSDLGVPMQQASNDTWTTGSSSSRAARHQRQNSSVDIGERRSRAGTTTGAGGLDALGVFDNSAWGESIRRSFTLRRNGTRRGEGR